jgi:hypothetical protein
MTISRLRETPAVCFGLALAAAIAFGWPPRTALAGPPLIADDPNTIGPGNAQPIFATSVLSRRNRTIVRGPILDMTIGAVDSLDVTLVVSFNSVHRELEARAWEFLGVITPGIKWEFFRRDRGSLCLSPAFSVETLAPGSPLFLLPLQGEIEVGDIEATLGFDLGYVLASRAPDELLAAVYGQVAVTKQLTFQGEIWFFGSTTDNPNDFVLSLGTTNLGLTFGLTYLLMAKSKKTLELLAAVSPGLLSSGESSLDVRAYLGFQYTFPKPRRATAARAPVGQRPRFEGRD